MANCLICGQLLKGNGKQWCQNHYREIMKNRNQSGNKNPYWKGGKTMHSKGWVYILISGKYVLEHRYIMEQVLGRKLKTKEIVHHLNGIKIDNRPENLKVMTQGEHLKVHGLSSGTHCPRDPLTGRLMKKNC